MRAKNPIRLTPRERLSRGLQYTAVGPVDVTRGLVGLGAHSAQAGASSLRRRYHEGQLARDIQHAQEALVQELAAAQEVVTGLPEALAAGPSLTPAQAAAVGARRSRRGGARGRRVRRSRSSAARSSAEPSALPPSVDVENRP